MFKLLDEFEFKRLSIPKDAKATDFAKATGLFTFDKTKDSGEAQYFLCSEDDNKVSIVSHDGKLDSLYKHTKWYAGVRPVMDFDTITLIFPELALFPKFNYGYYPSNRIETDERIPTGIFMKLPVPGDGICKGYSVIECEVYEGDNKKYIEYPMKKMLTTIDNRTIIENQIFKYELKPITWLYDSKLQIAVTDKVLYGGIAYSLNGNNEIYDSLKLFEDSVYDTLDIYDYDIAKSNKKVKKKTKKY